MCQNMSFFHRLRGKYIKYNAIRKVRGGARKMLTQSAGRWRFGDFKTSVRGGTKNFGVSSTIIMAASLTAAIPEYPDTMSMTKRFAFRS